MKTKLLFLLFFIASITAFSQQYITGKVSSEFDAALQNVVIFNTRTDEKVLSDKEGNFTIAAKPTDELRFIKSGYDRISSKISAQNFSEPLNILLTKSPYDIAEIELKFQATGNLEKDIKTLDPSKRVVALNSTMKAYMMTPPTDVAPKLSVPSAFAAPNYNAGQVNILGIASAVFGLIKKAKNPPITTPNYAETQAFYRRIKNTMDMSFYTSRGFDEEQIDHFLIYADQNYSLAKLYRKNFDISAIDIAMKLAYKEYIKTHKVGS
ncbi:carboxypeptidase regulatory-like domain-containing protein [Kaistella flava (ex Peng et al. 2021)]|uniref:Carboxypeptidase regulatory-like domain-containing protein n=1 Tax=Kaistella flava (ex Peng et al. 2021) TaxID=2038776 RepID=A0A7M2YB92_9FLAO|nr:carboxypeptidase regulatory-like domain-containing protein [Kaistella flava (ex Peng et al. 2021)]QOW10854.1 carboxypeptidase regulatory-like domain-containing protein [Kaistella flava (ex Peng et al. 2021)]